MDFGALIQQDDTPVNVYLKPANRFVFSLGDIIDYRVTVGSTEVRVQRNVRKPVFREGDSCGLTFSTLHWYDETGARVEA